MVCDAKSFLQQIEIGSPFHPCDVPCHLAKLLASIFGEVLFFMMLQRNRRSPSWSTIWDDYVKRSLHKGHILLAPSPRIWKVLLCAPPSWMNTANFTHNLTLTSPKKRQAPLCLKLFPSEEKNTLRSAPKSWLNPAATFLIQVENSVTMQNQHSSWDKAAFPNYRKLQ